MTILDQLLAVQFANTARRRRMRVGGGQGSATPPPTITTPGSIDEQPLVGVATTVSEAIVTGADTTEYQWYRGAPTTTPISGATSATYTPVDADFGLTLYRRATYTNGAGSTVEDLAAPAVTGKTYSDDFASYTVGNTWTQIDTLYDRNNTGVDPSIVSDATGPSGKAMRVAASVGNGRFIRQTSATTFGAANTALTSRTQGLFLFKHIGANSGRYALGLSESTLTWIGPRVLVRGGSVYHQIDTDDINNAVGTFLGTLTVNNYYWIRCEQEGDQFKVKLWDFGDPEPSTFAARTTSASFDPPSPSWGIRFASAYPADQFDLLWQSGGYNTDAPYWPGFSPPFEPSSDPMTFAAGSTATTFSQNDGEIVWTFGDV